MRASVVRQVAALARVAQAGMHEHRGLVAPHVEMLLELRRMAREERRYADADAIRDALLAAGIEVHDGAGGTGWEFTDPLAGSLASALRTSGGRAEGAEE
jgi:cysteinyl-tRNA synthetase